MNEVPPDQREADEVDDLYRRASAADTSRPSESVRRAVLDHAAQLAAQRSREAGPVNIDFTRRAANRPWRRPAIFGTLAAAALAGLMVVPQFFSSRPSDTSVSSISEYAQRQSAAAPVAKAPANSPQAPVIGSLAPPTAPARPAEAPPEPFPAPLQANEQAAQMQADKRRELKAAVSARAAARVDESRQANVADSARAETQTLAKILTTQAQRKADAGNADSAVGGAYPPSAANAPPSASESADATRSVQRMQNANSSLGALSANRARTAAPMAAPMPAAPTPAPAVDAAAKLRRAAEIGDLPTLQGLLDAKPAIDARDDSGRTALMLATLNGQSGAVNVLLASGADPNAADAQGTTPLQAAMAAHQPAIAAALRLAGAR